MPEFEITWKVALTKTNGEPLTLPTERNLAAAYPHLVERFPLISVRGDVGRDARRGEINISQGTSAGNARTAALYIRSGNPFASDAGIAHILGDSTIDVLVSDLTVTNAESGEITVHDKGYHVPDDDDVGQVARPSRARRTRGGGRQRLESYVGEPVAEEPVAEEPVAEEPVAEEPRIYLHHVGEAVDEEPEAVD